ncbi:MAG TPA: hypothetical protein VK327_08440, partial [Candidatus Paceibacterota bacterium]|nr:hypothetical protein [Candidatus Paceibacterota bacterium]
MKGLLKVLPWFFLALFGIEIVTVMLPKKDGEFHTVEFGRLPVLLNGRIQPMDTVAHNSLLQIRSTGDLPLEQVPSWKFWHHPKKLKSTEWLLEVFFKPELADTRPIFLIHHPDLISELKLGDKGVDKSGLRYYSFKEIEPVLNEISNQGQKAGNIEDAQRNTYEKQVLKLANAVFLYQRLKNSVEPEGTGDFAKMIADYKAALVPGLAAFRAQQTGETADKAALERFARAAQPFDELSNLAQPLIIPPANPETNRNGWKNIGAGLL